MKVIKRVEDLVVGKWYSFTQRLGQAPHLVGNHKIKYAYPDTNEFEVSTSHNIWCKLSDFDSILGPLDVDETDARKEKD